MAFRISLCMSLILAEFLTLRCTRESGKVAKEDSLFSADTGAIDSRARAGADATTNADTVPLVDIGMDGSDQDALQDYLGEHAPETYGVDDDDNDGIANALDNCVFLANPEQEDSDGDSVGDVCDNDDDGDGDPDGSDCAPLDPNVHHGATEECNGLDDDCDGQQDNGGMLWEFTPFAGGSGDAVLLPNGNVAFAGGGSKLHFLTQDGELVAEMDAVNQVIDDLAASDALKALFYPVVLGNVVAVDMDGNELWNVGSGGPVATGLAHWDTLVIGGSVDEQVFALDEVSGALQWQVELPAPMMSTPGVGADGVVYVGGMDNAMYALDGGGILWSVSTGGEVWSTPVVGPDGTVYFGSNDGWVYAIHSDGSVKWVAEVGGQIWQQVLVTGSGHAYASSTSQWITKFIAATGDVVWSKKIDSSSISSPVEGPLGNIYFGTGAGKLLCMDSEQGDILWSFQTSGSIQGAPLVVDNRLFVGSTSKFYGICLTGQ